MFIINTLSLKLREKSQYFKKWLKYNPMKIIIVTWGFSLNSERRIYRKQGKILFEKYIILETLYSTENSKIFLSKHTGLDDKRIIKKLIKNPVCEENYRREISILKSLKHGGIPIIYDIVEELNAYYIIEEYIEGINLYDYVRQKGMLSEELAVNFGVQISEIVAYLHGRKPIPVLHLDLKPQNIIVNNGKIFLIDFGNSMFLNSNRKYMSGTRGFAAPEQYTCEAVDMAADIYGLGVLLYFMVTGQTKMCDQNLLSDMNTLISESIRKIIIQCVLPKGDRVKDALWVAQNLNEIIQKKIRKSNNQKKEENLKENPLIISVIGSEKHIGVTHFSLALTGRLRERGINAVYEDFGGGVIRAIYKNTEECSLDCGLYYYSNIIMRYPYSNSITFKEDINCRVVDCHDIKEAEELLRSSKAVFIIAGKKQWEIENTRTLRQRVEKVCDCDRVVLLFSFVSEKEQGVPVFFNPLERDENVNGFLDVIINKFIEEDNVYKEKRKKGIFRFLAGKVKA